MHYEYKGKHYELPDGLSNEEALAKIKAHLANAPAGSAALGGVEGLSSAPWYAKPVVAGKSVLQGLEALPGAGGLVGGLLGSPGGPATSVGGAALGGAAGQSAKQLIRRGLGATAPETSGEAALEIGMSGAGEGVAELTGLGLARGARALAGPGRAGLDAGVGAAARRQGVEMPASALTTSRPIAYAEAFAQESPAGLAIGERLAKAESHLLALADQTVARASKLTSNVQRGEAIAKGLEQFKSQWMKRKNALYGEIDKELPGLTMKAEKTVALLDDIVSRKEGAARILEGGPSKNRSMFDGLLEGLTDKRPRSRALQSNDPKVEVTRRFREAQEGLQEKIRLIEEAGNLKTVQQGQKSLRKGYEQRDLVEDFVNRYDIDPNAEYVLNYSKMKGLLEKMKARIEKEVLEEYGGAAAAVSDEPVVRGLKDVSVRDFREAIREIDELTSSAHADPFAARHKGLLLKLSATLDDDLMTSLAREAPDTAARLQAANRAYAEGIDKINSVFGESINKFAQKGEYDLIAKAIANPRISVADVPRIMEVAGAEGTEAIQASVVADIVGRASKGADGSLTPRGLSRAMKLYGEERLQALLTKEQLSKLKDLATLTGSLERSQKIVHGSPTAGKARMMGYVGLATGTVAGGLPGAVGYVLGESIFSKFIGSKVGQRWLTTGFPLAGSVVGGVVRQTPRAAAAAYATREAEE